MLAFAPYGYFDSKGLQRKISVYLRTRKENKWLFTDRFVLGLTLICCHNRLIMMMSPHEHVTPV